MVIPTEIKKKIAKDWLAAFPHLSLYAQNKLYKIIGPIVVGIDIFKQPRADDYRPYLVAYPLWKPNLKECLDDPPIIQEMMDKKGFQFDIPYLKHNFYFPEVLKCAKEQLLIPFNEDIKIRFLYSMIDKKFSHTLVHSSTILQAKLYEFKYNTALYLGKTVLLNNIMDEIERSSKMWKTDTDIFKTRYGIFKDWLQELKDKINHREEFLMQIAMNRQDEKLKKLNYSELIE